MITTRVDAYDVDAYYDDAYGDDAYGDVAYYYDSQLQNKNKKSVLVLCSRLLLEGRYNY